MAPDPTPAAAHASRSDTTLRRLLGGIHLPFRRSSPSGSVIKQQVFLFCRPANGPFAVSAGNKDRSEADCGLSSLTSEIRFLVRGEGPARDSVRMRLRPVCVQEIRDGPVVLFTLLTSRTPMVGGCL
jgi:hypothetical protein